MAPTRYVYDPMGTANVIGGAVGAPVMTFGVTDLLGPIGRPVSRKVRVPVSCEDPGVPWSAPV